MPQPITGVDGSASDPTNQSNTSIRGDSIASSTENASGYAAANPELSISTGKRNRQPSRKFIENAVTESLLHDDTSSRPPKQHRSVSAKASGASTSKQKRANKRNDCDDSSASVLSPANNRLNAGRASKKQGILHCDFSSKESVNKWFPFQDGKGRYSVPQLLLDRFSSRKAKAHYVTEWRGLSSSQQNAKRKELGVNDVVEPHIVPVAKPAKSSQPSQLVRYQNMPFDPDCDMDKGGEYDDVFEYVLHDAEKNAGFSPDRLSCKAIRAAASKKLSQNKANKKRTEKRKEDAEAKVMSLCFLCTDTAQLTYLCYKGHQRYAPTRQDCRADCQAGQEYSRQTPPYHEGSAYETTSPK